MNYHCYLHIFCLIVVDVSHIPSIGGYLCCICWGPLSTISANLGYIGLYLRIYAATYFEILFGPYLSANCTDIWILYFFCYWLVVFAECSPTDMMRIK